MASETIPGTAFQLEGGEHGLVAVKMGPAVSAGPYFVIDPINGGYYANHSEVDGIEKSPRLIAEEPADDETVGGDA